MIHNIKKNLSYIANCMKNRSAKFSLVCGHGDVVDVEVFALHIASYIKHIYYYPTLYSRRRRTHNNIVLCAYNVMVYTCIHPPDYRSCLLLLLGQSTIQSIYFNIYVHACIIICEIFICILNVVGTTPKNKYHNCFIKMINIRFCLSQLELKRMFMSQPRLGKQCLCETKSVLLFG